MALRRSKRSTTIAATRKSAQDAAAPRQKRAGRQAGHGSKSNLTGTRIEPTENQPTQPTRLGSEGQATVGGKRKRDDDATNTGVRKKRQLDAAPTSSQPVPARGDQDRQAAIGGKRKREDDVTKTGVGKKRQLEGSPLNARTAQLLTADQASHAKYDHASPLVIERIDPFRATSRAETFPTNAEFATNATEGERLLEALFAVVSKKRLLLEKQKLYDDHLEKHDRYAGAAQKADTLLDDLQREKDLRPVSQEHQAEIEECQANLEIIAPARDRSRKQADRFMKEMSAFQSQVDSDIKGLLVYNERLKDDQALHIFANSEPFWEIFAALRVAHTAAESVKARFEAIEVEKQAIGSQMDDCFKRTLTNRLMRANVSDKAKAAANLPESDGNGSTGQHLRTLCELESEREKLEQEELFRENRKFASQSEELLRLAERAFLHAGLLELDGSTELPREEQQRTPSNFPGLEAIARPNHASAPASPAIEHRVNDQSEEEQATGQSDAPIPVPQPVTVEVEPSAIDLATTMKKPAVQKKFEQVRDEFRAIKQEFEGESPSYRRLTEDDIAGYPQPLSDDDKGAVLFLKLQSRTKAYRLAEKEFNAWREAAIKHGFERELAEDKAVEIAPDRSDDGYPDVLFVVKREKAGPKVERWWSDDRVRKSPSVQHSSVNTNLKRMASLAFDEDVLDEVRSNVWQERIAQNNKVREDLRKAGPFEVAENDFHARNKTPPRRHLSV